MIEDLLRGLMFNDSPVSSPQFAEAAEAPAPSMKDQSRLPSEPPPPPPSPNPGGMFGGMPGWDPGERPTEMGDAPYQPPASPMRFTDEGGSRPSELPPIMTRGRGTSGMLGGGSDTDELMGGPERMPGQQPSYGPGARPPSNGGIISMIGNAMGASPDNTERFRRGLAAGLSSLKGEHGMFSGFSGAGAAMQGGDQYADKNFAGDRAQSNEDRNFGLKSRALDSQDAYHKGMLERNNFDLIPGMEKGEDGNDVSGAYTFNRRTGQYEFKPGVNPASRGGRSGGGPGQTERMVKDLIDEGYSREEAIGIVKRGGGSEADRLRAERLALDAAKNDKDYAKDPQGTIEKYRKQYVKPPASSSRYDVDQSMKNAEAAINKAVRSGNGEALDRILKKAEAAGMDRKQLQTLIDTARSGSVF